jgi:hypothetical protein
VYNGEVRSRPQETPVGSSTAVATPTADPGSVAHDFDFYPRAAAGTYRAISLRSFDPEIMESTRIA